MVNPWAKIGEELTLRRREERRLKALRKGFGITPIKWLVPQLIRII